MNTRITYRPGIAIALLLLLVPACSTAGETSIPQTTSQPAANSSVTATLTPATTPNAQTAPVTNVVASMTSAPTSITQPAGTNADPVLLTVKSSRMFSNTAMTLIILLTDPYGKIINFDGAISTYIWENPDISRLGRGALLQKWENIPVSQTDHYEADFGKYITFTYNGFAPHQVQSVYTDVTLVTGGKTFKWEGMMPLTMGADCPCQTEDPSY